MDSLNGENYFKSIFHILIIFLLLSCSSCDLSNNWNIKKNVSQTGGEDISSDDVFYVNGKTTITQYGISWIFEGDKRDCIGKFLNGDYYIIGVANLLSIEPEPSNGRNGSMINPAVGEEQAYDNRAENFNANIGVSLPYTLKPGESLVSTISNLIETGQVKDFAGEDNRATNARLNTAAVLTCLAAKPDENTFRPPYIGTDKPLYTFSGLTENMLPEVTYDLTIVPSYIFETAYDYYIRGFKRPWLIHQYDWLGRGIHPLYNMKNYHAEIDKFFGGASLLLLVDPGTLSGKREELLMYYLQCGIDYYHMCIQGHGDAAFNVWPIVFTGVILNNYNIYNVFINKQNKYDAKEQKMTYFLPDDITSTRISSILTKGQLWTGYKHPKNLTRPAWRQDPENAEHEHLHPSEWAGCGDSEGGIKRERYRQINSVAYPAYALSALIVAKHYSGTLDVIKMFSHNAFFDYTDRWMNEDMSIHCKTISDIWSGVTYGDPNPVSYQTSGSKFVDGMWKKYRDNY